MNCKNCFGASFNDCEECERRNNMLIEVKYLRDGIQEIEQIANGDWVDLRTAEDIHMQKGDFALIPLGVAMKLPSNCEALIIPRSSTFMKYGIIMSNSVGLIDESYFGDDDEWKFPAYAISSVYIPKNTRICQFRIIEHQPPITFRGTEHLSNKSRGGFGSTGER